MQRQSGRNQPEHPEGYGGFSETAAESLRTLSGNCYSQTVNIINNTNNFKSRRKVSEDTLTGHFIRYACSAAG